MAEAQEKHNKLFYSKSLRVKAIEFLNNRRNASNLLDVLHDLETTPYTSTCLLTLEMIFTELLKRRDMYEEVVPLKPLEQRDPEGQFRLWLRTAYEQTWVQVLSHLEYGKPSDQQQSLVTAMKLIAFEGKYPLDSEDSNFPTMKLKAVLIKLLSSSNTSHLFSKFQEYTAYTDVLFFVWKSLPAITSKSQSPSELYIKNLLELIDKIPVNKQTNPIMMCGIKGKAGHFDYQTVKKSINKVWNTIMRWNHTSATHKQMLIILLERVLPHLDNPLLLTDFLMDSLDVGGPISLLALQGVFTMIQVHNLDYPLFFEKLYSMFEPEIFHTKFKARLFYLSDMFLNSTHLPESLVAAFIKRLARLALVAPSEDILLIIMFIGNLILRHPGLKRLINMPGGGCEVSSDPYVMDERDPYKSNAFESSLWELKALQHHALPQIATAARFIDLPLPSIEWDITQILDKSLDEMFEKEIRKKAKEIVLTFTKPQSLALPKGEVVADYWKLTT